MASTRLVPTVAETLRHPAFPTAIWQLEPDRKGLAPVAEGRGGPFNISWEIHGSGPVKLVLIMGLGGFKTAWQRQTLHFGHERREKYSVLVFDNRGMGDSDIPLMRYSTSDMARDIIDVLVHVGWLPPDPYTPSKSRTLHIAGISLGGMIAQEIGCLIPSHLSTLSLLCTAVAVKNTTSYVENITNRASMLMPKSADRAVDDAARAMFNHAWCGEPDTTHVPDPAATPRCLPPRAPPSAEPPTAGAPPPKVDPLPKTYLHFATNGERFVAQEMTKRLDKERFTAKGFVLQLIAAGWHHKSETQLAEMAEAVGRERILVMHGTEDRMISPPHGKTVIEHVRPGVGLIVEGMGHAPLVERTAWFNELMEERFELGERLDGRV